jgi:predicted  nucleic acid-binding Zn-ribbon protein
MDENGTLLLEIQTIDGEAVRIGKQLASYPKQIAQLEGAAAQARAGLESARKSLKEARASRGVLETEVGQKQEEVKRFLNQQMQVKTNKEYQAITHQIETLNGIISDLETEVLEALDKEETLEARIEQLKEDETHAVREASTEKERIGALEVEKRARLEKLQSERAVYVAKLPEELAEKYEILFERYPGTAIVPTDAKTCGGCHMALLAATVQEVHESGTLAPCSHCRRLLYLK